MIQKIKEYLKPYKWMHYMLKNGFIFRDELPYFRWSFSQFGEDLVLESFFERKGIQNGFYVEIGAFEPIYLSNTYYFYKKGWRGILIEPNPLSFRKLNERRKGDILLNVAVSDHDGTVDFVCDRAYSGIIDQNYLFSEKGKESLKIQCKRLENILSANVPNGQKIHFMSIDCEGHDETILHTNDWARFRPLVLLIEEHGDQAKESVLEYLKSQRYGFYGRCGVTLLFIDLENC
jgi:FkbM family methyltransferase